MTGKAVTEATASIAVQETYAELQAKCKALEEKLAAAEAESSHILDKVGFATRIVGTDFRVRRINHACCSMASASPDGAIGKKCWEVTPGPLCHTPECYVARIINGENELSDEVFRKNPDGSKSFCHITAVPLKNNDGKLVAVLEIFQDISELKHYQEMIRESEERYRTLIELETEVGEAILMVQDVDGRAGKYMFISDQWPRMTGYSKEELQDMTFFDVINPEYHETEMKRYRNQFSETKISSPFELIITRKNGTHLPVELVVALSSHIGTPAQVAYIRDISTRKSLELELREQRNRYLSLFENAPIAIWEMDCSPIKNYFTQLRADGITGLREYFAANPDKKVQYSCIHKIIDVNDATLSMWEAVDKEEFFSRFGELIKHQPIISSSFHNTLMAMAEGSMSFAYDEMILTIKGTQKHLHTEFRIAPGCEDTWNQVLLCQTDITNRWKAEQSLQQYRGRLEEMVTARTSQLEQEIELRRFAEKRTTELYEEEGRLRRVLEKQMRERVEFTRALIHEIKTPLTPLLAASEMLTTQCKGNLENNLSKHLYESACELNSRIDELFDFTRGEMGTLRLKLTQVDLPRLFHSILESTKPQALYKKQNLIVQIDPALHTAFVDGGRLRQVALNVLNNALKFTPSGGTISFTATPLENELLVKVNDTGPGIAKQEQAFLFQAYHRSNNGKEHFSGMGLGLAISKTIVDLHGGRIWVESEEGKGSSFFFSIPLNLTACIEEYL